MIKVEKFVVGPLESNSYLVYSAGNTKCLIIDAGGDYDIISARAKILGLTVGALLLTHGHFDHTAEAFKAQKSGVKVYISKKDAYMLSSATDSLASGFGVTYRPTENYSVIDSGVFDICGFNVEVINTPGHTAGSLCYKIEDALFAGDTVFKYGYGRYDLPTGSFSDLVNSFKKLKKYSELKVFCGHGEETDLEREKKINPLFLYED